MSFTLNLAATHGNQCSTQRLQGEVICACRMSSEMSGRSPTFANQGKPDLVRRDVHHQRIVVLRRHSASIDKKGNPPLHHQLRM